MEDNREIVNITFLHMCCSSGFKELMTWIKNYEEQKNVKVKVHTISYFNVRDGGYPKQFNFDLESLRSKSYIILDEEIITL
jgi:predicted MPP superfamily phosphohydrolase